MREAQQEREEETPSKCSLGTDESIRRKVADISFHVTEMLRVQQQHQHEHEGIIDSRLIRTPQEAAEDDHIAASALLREYNLCVQKCFNESFLAASVIASGKLKIDTSSGVIDGLSLIADSLPIASGLLSAMTIAAEKVGEARETARYSNLGRLNPSSDPIVSRSLAMKIARALTLEFHSEIEREVFVKEKSRFSQMKSWFISAVTRVDEKLARGTFGENLTGTQYVALNHARLALGAVFAMSVRELDGIVNDEEKVLGVLVSAVTDEYTSSGRVCVNPLPPSSSSSSSSSSFSVPSGTPSPFPPSPSLHGVAAVATAAGDGVASSSTVERHSDKLKRLEEDNRMLKSLMAKTQKESAETRRVLNTFVDTNIGVDGKVTAAMKDKDGRVRVVVDNPKVDEIAHEMAHEVTDLKDRLQELEHQTEMEKLKKMKEKKKKGVLGLGL